MTSDTAYLPFIARKKSGPEIYLIRFYYFT